MVAEAEPTVVAGATVDCEAARSRFNADCGDYELIVCHDDGLYRHLLLKEPKGVSWAAYSIITWPGFLTITSGHGTWTFARDRDMFAFFRGNPDQPRINPGYWAEKLVGGVTGGRVSAQEYDEDRWREHVTRYASADWSGWHGPEGEALRADVADKLLDRSDWEYPGDHEESAREAVNGYRFDWCMDGDGQVTATLHKREHNVVRFRFTDTWEWDLKGYSFHFLWCCWAIVHGIAAYDTAKAAAS